MIDATTDGLDVTQWYDFDENEWKRSDGKPVCQDHGWWPTSQCPFHKQRGAQ